VSGRVAQRAAECAPSTCAERVEERANGPKGFTGAGPACARAYDPAERAPDRVDERVAERVDGRMDGRAPRAPTGAPPSGRKGRACVAQRVARWSGPARDDTVGRQREGEEEGEQQQAAIARRASKESILTYCLD
jgi:hypothetical protein